MAQQTKKSSTAQASAKFASHTAETVQQTEKKVLEMGRENVENLMSAADSVNRVASECADICSGNMSTLVESGSQTARTCQDISSEVMQCCNRAFSDFAELSQEAFACRTINDVIELQNKAVQQASENYFDTANKLSKLWFDACAEAMEPLNERAAVASEQLRKAMAA